MVKLKKITDNSWLVLSKSDMPIKIGLLSKQKGKFILLAQNAKTEFKNQNEISDFFSENVFEHEESDSGTYHDFKVYVKGFPVKFEKVFECSLPDEDDFKEYSNLPVFTKKQESSSYFAAGYYALDFGNYGWSPFYCPRLATVMKYDTVGPFKTEDDLNEEISALKQGFDNGSQKIKAVHGSSE